MSTEVLTQSLSAGVKATFGSGSMFVITTATFPVNIVARSIGSSSKNRTFTNVPAGFKFTADDPSDGFDTLEITSANAQVFSIAVGTDDVEFSNAVTVTGGVLTTEVPASTLTDNAPVLTTASVTALFPVNAARRRMTIFADPANAGTVYLRVHGAARRHGFVQPGMTLEMDGTYAVDYDDAVGGNNLYLFEES